MADLSTTTAPQLAPQRAAQIRESFARQGFMRSIGVTLEELTHGRCVLLLPYSEAVGQQQGFFHGGVIGALGDVAGGYAASSALPLGTEVVTLEYKVNFLRPAVGSRLVAEGIVLRAGRSVVVTRIDVFAEHQGQRSQCAALQQSIMPTPAGI